MNTDNRTDDELNKVIAEWCGWHHIIDDEYGPLRGCKSGEVVVPGFVFTDIPNYCRDLNAVHEAEKQIFLLQQTWEEYVKYLTNDVSSECANAIHSPPRQRAEALVRVIEKTTKQ